MRTWTKEEIKDLMLRNDKVLYNSILQVYYRQTEDEKSDGQTSHRNGVGFNGVDSPILSNFALGIQKYGKLTDRQKEIARKKMVRYTSQVTRYANEYEKQKVTDISY